MYTQRKALYAALEKSRGSRLIAYVTGDRPNLETQIHSEVYDFVANHLDLIGVVPKISIYLYTRGGATLAAWSMVNLIRQFCDEFEVIIPSKAHSAGTLMCLGANEIVMTKQATLGPIDPSVAGPLNPLIPGASNAAKFPVSVEAINGFFELCKESAGLKSPQEMSAIAIKLADHVHPLVLGEVHRTKSQIQMLARKLLSNHVKDKQKVDTIVKFLCSESGSHDYTLHRREALAMGLPVRKPDDGLYKQIKTTYDDIADELQLRSKFDAMLHLAGNPSANYSFRRALVESVAGGSDFLITEGTITRTNNAPNPQVQFQDQRLFEGWRHENA